MRGAEFDPQRSFALAVALHQEGRLTEAQTLYTNVLTAMPDAVMAWTYMGIAQLQSGQWAGAVHHLSQSLTLQPGELDPLIYRGMALANLGRHGEAVADFEAAAYLAPERSDLLNSLGVSLMAIHRTEDAWHWFQRAMVVDPTCLVACFNGGNALQALGRLDEAFQCFERAMQLDPDYPNLMGYWLGLKMQLCDWTGLEDACARLASRIDAGVPVSVPFSALSTLCTPMQLRRCAELFAQTQLPPVAPPLPVCASTRSKIRLGYFSADFHEHATAYLAAGLFEQHDRTAFEVFAFSCGPALQQPMRQRLEAAFDRFIDIQGHTDAEAAALARSLGVDIAIDLKGYTGDARPGIFCHRPAPLQVSYLGYPGTLGVGHMDYLVADAVLVPEQDRAHYAEKIITLPGSYQVNDDSRPQPRPRADRSQLGLPEHGLVFCCFNNSFKITPDVFAVWMRLLKACPGSVLWLMASAPTATANLVAAARGHGVDPARLVFAPRMPQQAHLDRLSAADLFLDTFWLNAHTTASDALWAGVPVITCPGSTFGSRVAASLLTGLGLENLIAASPLAYEALALKLAQDPDRLRGVRQQLAAHRRTHALFNTGLFARRIEQAYATMWARYRRGDPPAHFEIAA